MERYYPKLTNQYEGHVKCLSEGGLLLCEGGPLLSEGDPHLSEGNLLQAVGLHGYLFLKTILNVIKIVESFKM